MDMDQQIEESKKEFAVCMKYYEFRCATCNYFSGILVDRESGFCIFNCCFKYDNEFCLYHEKGEFVNTYIAARVSRENQKRGLPIWV